MLEVLQAVGAIALGVWIGRGLLARFLPDEGLNYTDALLLHWALEPDEPPRLADYFREGARQARALANRPAETDVERIQWLLETAYAGPVTRGPGHVWVYQFDDE